MEASRFTTSKAANGYLNQNGVKIGRELHLKEGVRTTGEVREVNYSERNTVLCSTLQKEPKVVSYRTQLSY